MLVWFIFYKYYKLTERALLRVINICIKLGVNNNLTQIHSKKHYGTLSPL